MSAGRRWGLVAGALLVLAAVVVIYAGLYNIAADVPHTPPVYWLLETIRGRSVAARSRDIVVPKDLDDANRISKGAGQYAEMCSGCHLAPGMKRTEISRGLYPRAPELRHKTDFTPAEQFWIVKHGVKMTGMPAWGVTHDDDLLWDVVAFVRKLPELTPEQCEERSETRRANARNGNGPRPRAWRRAPVGIQCSACSPDAAPKSGCGSPKPSAP
jgi:mono/diheme cytochrome c family protein